LTETINLSRLYAVMQHKSARQRIVLFLFAAGYSGDQIQRMTVKDLLAVNMPDDLNVYRAEVIEDLANSGNSAPAFVYPNGNLLVEADFRRLLRETTKRCFGKPLTQKQFREKIR